MVRLPAHADREAMPYLEMTAVHKRYGGVVALDGASLRAEQGTVHALVGPNGSGKSTLNKTLTGVVAPDRADIRVDGTPVAFAGPRQAQEAGIAAVYQDLSLVPQLSVIENIELGIEPQRALGYIDRTAQADRARGVIERFATAFEGDPWLDGPVARLSPGEQQIVEVCKAVAREPRILILDEATAALRAAQVATLFEIIRELAAQGVLVVFTSHRMDEVYDICTRATVLRGGETIGEVDLDETGRGDLVEMMVGRRTGAGDDATAEPRRPAADTDRPVALEVRGLRSDGVDGVSLTVRSGEIVGLGGLQGQGQSELLAALYGAQRIRAGEVLIDGTPRRLRRPGQAVAAGIALIPGDRMREGLFPVRPILENLTLPSVDRRATAGVLSGSRERAAARDAVQRLSIKLGGLDDAVGTLSGGNQQKVVVGRWLLTDPRIVLMDDPTKGIDVGAKDELYAVMRELTGDGVSVVFNSSDDQELLEVSDRVVVLYEGRIVDELSGDRLTEDQLLGASLRVDGRDGGGATPDGPAEEPA